MLANVVLAVNNDNGPNHDVQLVYVSKHVIAINIYYLGFSDEHAGIHDVSCSHRVIINFYDQFHLHFEIDIYCIT